MASYKVPQDVEADDKLLGPFSFRQFVYLMIVGGALFVSFLLFQVFPLLSLAPLPIIIFFALLALPLKKDQPMETYLAAIVSFYVKPNHRFWIPGQSESTILITTPKKVEENRVRDITEEEANHRLSFLANIVDTEGHAIKNTSSPMRDEFYAEAYNTTDMFDDRSGITRLSNLITKEQQEHHADVVNQMRTAIKNSEFNPDNAVSRVQAMRGEHVIQPMSHAPQVSESVVQPNLPAPSSDEPPADNAQDNNEVYIPLH